MLSFVFVLCLLPLGLCVGVLALQCLLGWRQPGPALGSGDEQAPALAVLMPAHNEQAGIVATVGALLPQLRPGDRLLVVADNCDDDTAALARAAGAEVVERQHASDRGKGYALAFGLAHLSLQPPPVVVVVDADCQVLPGSLPRLARLAVQLQRPVQARYLMDLPAAPSLARKVAGLAWRVRNVARPLGAARLGWPCQLMGTGMAFPWHLLTPAQLANADLVEDMRLGLDLARAGHAPWFCDEAEVRSTFPDAERAAQTQRTRWEHGHLASILAHAPGLLAQALRRRSWPLLGLALDLMVPPLALLASLVMLACLAGGVWWRFNGGLAPLVLSLALLATLVLAVALAWHRHGREVLSAAEWLAIPGYVLGKLPVYGRFLVRREKRWVRTDRDPS